MGGTLAGDPSGSPFSTWLVAPDGAAVFVVWPRGYSARFEAHFELIDRNDPVVAREGAWIDLSLNRKSDMGTVDHLYRTWWVNADCYPPMH